MKFITVPILLLLILACQKAAPEIVKEPNIENPILGAWEIKAIHWRTADTTYSIQEAQPGMFILSKENYSIMWIPTEEPRTPFENLSEPTEEEQMYGFSTVVFNSGSYIMTDSTLTTTAKIAKVPGFEGGKQFYNYQLENEQLKLTMFDETYPNGDKPTWFGRYVTEFVLEKLD